MTENSWHSGDQVHEWAKDVPHRFEGDPIHVFDGENTALFAQ